MGIEDYWTVISEVFPSSINYSAIGTKMVFDHVMLDLNHVLYHVGSFCSDEVQIDAILDHLDYLLTQFPARKSIFVALDGPGAFPDSPNFSVCASSISLHAALFSPIYSIHINKSYIFFPTHSIVSKYSALERHKNPNLLTLASK